MRILIVDENADFRTVLSEYLREGLASAATAAHKEKREAPAALAVKQWNPGRQGVPQEGKSGFKWNFDVVLIDSHIEPANPVEWLTAARKGVPKFPPVVMLTSGHDDSDMLMSAMKLGVVDCVSRLELTPKRLYQALDGAVTERRGQDTIENHLQTNSYKVFDLTPAAAAVAPRAPDGAPQIRGY